LNTNIPSRTQIIPDYLTPVTTSQGSAPQNALDMSDVQTGTVYSKYPLNAGDVVAASNAGSLDSINEGVPDNWVVTSFDPGDNDPVVQNLKRGDYFDIMVTNMKKSDTSTQVSEDQNNVTSNIKVGQWLFRNVMVLDNPSATVTSDSSDSSNGATSQTQNTTTMFLLGMSPQNATILAMAASQFTMKLVISPQQNSYTSPKTLDALYKNFDFNDVIAKNPNGIIASDCVDSSTGEDLSSDCTDNTFSPQERDRFGVPYNVGSGDTRDANGNPQPLTKFEIEWCTQLFYDSSNKYYYYKNIGDQTDNDAKLAAAKDDYYWGSKWDDSKKYCSDHNAKATQATPDGKTPDFKTLLKNEKDLKTKLANSSSKDSFRSSSSSDQSASGDNGSTDGSDSSTE
jgi:hypothetical protein